MNIELLNLICTDFNVKEEGEFYSFEINDNLNYYTKWTVNKKFTILKKFPREWNLKYNLNENWFMTSDKVFDALNYALILISKKYAPEILA